MNNYSHIKRFAFLALVATFFTLFVGKVIAQQNIYCGTTVCQIVSCNFNPVTGACTATKGSCSFVNCACTTTTPEGWCQQTLKNGTTCIKSHTEQKDATCYRSKCVRSEWVYYYGYKVKVCTQTATEAYGCTKTVTICDQYNQVPGGCAPRTKELSCGSGGSGGPSCTAQAACTPTCPAGKVPYDTGSGTSSTTSCSYTTGNVVSGSCQTNAVSKQCWDAIVAPVVTVNNLDNVANNGCSAAVGYMGKDANNTNQIKVDYASNNSANPYTALQVWFAAGGATPPSISKIYDTGTGDLLSNGSYGMLLRNVGSTWDIYIPGIENGSTPTWVKAGTIGTGLRAEILGTSNQKLMGIKDVTVSTAGTTVTLQFSIQYYHEDSGVANYEKANEGSTKIYATANAQSSFLPSGGNTITTVPAWNDSGKSWILDLTAPTSDKLTVSVLDTTHLNVDWQYSDAGSSLIRVVGDASISNNTGTPDNIDDETSGVNNYVFGSGSNQYAGTHLWSTGVSSRIDRVDMNTNQSGTVTFTSNGFDSACNSTNATATFPFGVAWIATKGGVVNAGSSSGLSLTALTGHTAFSNDAYWDSPFAFYNDEADVTSELITASSLSVNALLHPSVGAVRSLNHFDNNNRQNYWYAELLKRTDLKVTQNPNNFVVVNNSSDTTVSGNSSSIGSCTTSKGCVVKVTGNLNVSSGFVCDTQTVFFTSGKTTLNGDITAPNQDDGCMFVSKGDIVVAAGTYKSGASSYPVYDIVEAYMITDGIIDIPLADSAQNVRDGLLVHGSMLGFGSSTGSSFKLARSLKILHNASFPALAIHFDNRYLGFAPIFFGGDNEGFRREVGFKPL